MAWFKRQSKGIQTPTEEKKDTPVAEKKTETKTSDKK